MSQIKTLNGVQYTLPQYNDTGWGANTGNVLTQYIAAIADVTLQLSGGSFTLTADTNFGATYGLVSAYFTSRTANAATAGAVRLAKTDVVSWRNNANGANIDLSKNTSDELLWNSSRIILAGGGLIVNADVSASAGIVYSKLNLTGGIVNADISASAAIAYSKLALTGTIVNADVSASAAIAYSKLALTSSIVGADVSASAAIAYSKLTLTGSIVNADINASAAIAMSKLAALTASRALVTDGSGFHAVATTTATEIGYVNGVTSAIQTQMDLKAPKASPTFTGTVTVPNGSGVTDAAAFGQVNMVLIATATASNSATLDFTSISNSVYDSYLLVGHSIVLATNAQNLLLRVSVGGTFKTTDYCNQDFRITNAGSGVSGNLFGTGATAMVIGSSGDTNANSGTGVGQNFWINFNNCGQTSTIKACTFTSILLGSQMLTILGGGGYSPASDAVDGFRFLAASGNITSGVIKLYGIRA